MNYNFYVDFIFNRILIFYGYILLKILTSRNGGTKLLLNLVHHRFFAHQSHHLIGNPGRQERMESLQ